LRPAKRASEVIDAPFTEGAGPAAPHGPSSMRAPHSAARGANADAHDRYDGGNSPSPGASGEPRGTAGSVQSPGVATRLYVIPGSAPSRAARLMLEHKGIEYSRVDLIAALHRPLLRARGFEGNTVPALRIDGRRIQSTRKISQALDELHPTPPLFPTDPARRGAVEEAERWGDQALQPVPRRLSWWALKRDRSGAKGFLDGARLGIPVSLAARTAGPIIWIQARHDKADDEAVRGDMQALPGMLDKIDGWIAEGILDGEELNAADFQIATSVRLLMCFDDLRPAIQGRPVGALAMRICPEFPGRIGPVLESAGHQPL
jgi:glutathione S-transferase